MLATEWSCELAHATSTHSNGHRLRSHSAIAAIAVLRLLYPLQFFIGFYFSIGITASIIVPLCGYCGAANRR